MSKLPETAVHLGHAITSADDDGVVKIVERVGNNPKEIANVVEALPVSQVIPFLQVVENLLREERIKDIRLWIVWLHITFKSHSTYLSTVSDLNRKIAALSEWMNARTQNFDKLLQLQGKLEIITEQMRRNTATVKLADQPAVMTFEE